MTISGTTVIPSSMGESGLDNNKRRFWGASSNAPPHQKTGGTKICVDEAELRRLAFGWEMEYEELLQQVHEASEAEIAEYGTYDGE